MTRCCCHRCAALVAALLRDIVAWKPPLQVGSWMHFRARQNGFPKMKRINVLNVFPSFPRMLPPEAWPIKNLSVGAQWFFCTWCVDFFRSTDHQRSLELTRKTSIFSVGSIFMEELSPPFGKKKLGTDITKMLKTSSETIGRIDGRLIINRCRC